MKVSCLVVCEGSSDFAFINGVLKHLEKSSSTKFEARLLEPQYDATSCRYDKFGYTQIRSWCKKAAHIKQTTGRDWIGAQLALSRADCLLIHMDTDIADLLELNGSSFNGNVKGRREWCSNSLDSWLGAELGTDCHYILPTWQIETWLLATYDNKTNPKVFLTTSTDYESIQNVEEYLIKLGYQADSTKPERLYKEKELFENNPQYLLRLQENFSLAKSRCKELRNFERLLMDLSS